MSEYCKKEYDRYIADIDSDKPYVGQEIFECATGINERQCAFRYRQIHGATIRMGGFANLSHYINKNAAEDYYLFSRLEQENEEMKNRIADLEQERQKILDLIKSQCGLPDPVEACRAILQTIKNAESDDGI